VVNPLGALESAVGNATDCVHVDGSSGPCGDVQPAYVDGDLPAGHRGWREHDLHALGHAGPGGQPGAIPERATAKSRTGLHPDGRDGSVRGGGRSAAGRYAAGVVPVRRRVGIAGEAGLPAAGFGRGQAGLYPAPEVLCSGTGAATASGMASLGTCTIPAGKVTPGDRVEARFDFEHEGHGAGWSVEVHWGGSTVLRRDAAASEGLLTGGWRRPSR